jgi:hypothetical protein
MTEIKEENGNGKKLEISKWKNRRRMAYISLFSTILFTFLLFYTIPIDKVNALKEPITWMYFCNASIVGAYFGFTTWAAKK